jgi:hypothetical protein
MRLHPCIRPIQRICSNQPVETRRTAARRTTGRGYPAIRGGVEPLGSLFQARPMGAQHTFKLPGKYVGTIIVVAVQVVIVPAGNALAVCRVDVLQADNICERIGLANERLEVLRQHRAPPREDFQSRDYYRAAQHRAFKINQGNLTGDVDDGILRGWLKREIQRRLSVTESTMPFCTVSLNPGAATLTM